MRPSASSHPRSSRVRPLALVPMYRLALGAPRRACASGRFQERGPVGGRHRRRGEASVRWPASAVTEVSCCWVGRSVAGTGRRGRTAPRLRLISFAGQSVGRRGAENKSERAVDNGAGLLLPVAPERQRAAERVTHPRRKQARPSTSASQLRQTRRTCLRRSRLIRAVR
jgi:hypothetical protein